MLHTEVLTPKQLELLDLLQEFVSDFYLVGGTALALQLGHRRSVDYDLFSEDSFDNDWILGVVKKYYPIDQVLINQKDQLTLIVHDVKMTWYRYPYVVIRAVNSVGGMKMPDPLHIAAMKAYALGKRAKWKDYVDIYFLLKEYSLKQITVCTQKLVGKEIFDEVMLREQMAYFDDIDYREEVEYMPGFEVDVAEVKQVLVGLAVGK